MIMLTPGEDDQEYWDAIVKNPSPWDITFVSSASNKTSVATYKMDKKCTYIPNKE